MGAIIPAEYPPDRPPGGHPRPPDLLETAVAGIAGGALTARLPDGRGGQGWLAREFFAAPQPEDPPRPAPPGGTDRAEARRAAAESALARTEDFLITMARAIAQTGWGPLPDRALQARMVRDAHRSCPMRLIRASRAVVSEAAGVRLAGGSWAPPAPPGAYSRIPCWHNKPVWLHLVDQQLATPQGEAARRSRQVAANTIRLVAADDATSAARRTGRDITTANATVGRRIGRGADQVKAARSWLAEMGLQITVVAGRYLTAAERRAAHAHHGGDQKRAAARRACTMPARPARRRPPGPGSGAGRSFPPLSTKLISKPLTSPKKNLGSRRARGRAAPGATAPPTMGARRMAASLAHWCPANGLGEPRAGSLTRLAAALDRLRVPGRYQCAGDLFAALDAMRVAEALPLDPRQIRNPLGYRIARLERLMAAQSPPTGPPPRSPATRPGLGPGKMPDG
jgi:hypothetical protein